jgi:hypothetical protein
VVIRLHEVVAREVVFAFVQSRPAPRICLNSMIESVGRCQDDAQTFPRSQYLLNSVIHGTCLYRSARVTGSHNLEVLRCRIPFTVGEMRACCYETDSLQRDAPILWIAFCDAQSLYQFL